MDDDLDQLQAKLQETSSIAWSCLLMLSAFGANMSLAAYVASLPRSPTGLSSGSLWVSGNQLNWVP